MGSRSSTHKKGSKKFGRDKVKCAQYRAAGTREKNKARRKRKEVKRQARLKDRLNKTTGLGA